MVKLNKMTELEYKDYYDFLIKDYAKENVKAGFWAEEESIEKSKKQTDSLLPKGLKTENQFLFSIYGDDDTNIGVLWVNISENKIYEKHAFIYDIRLNEASRGKGYGKKSLQAMDEWLRSLKVKDVALHVFDENKIAINLYEKSGYSFKSHNMLKKL